MNSIGLVLLGSLAVGGVFFGIKKIGDKAERSLDQRNYQNRVNNSSGIEKAQMLLREDALSFSSYVPKNGGWVTIPISHTYMDIVEMYYTFIKDAAQKVVDADNGEWLTALDKFGDSVSTDRTKRQLIVTRIYGIAFGIIVSKAANISNKKANKTAVKQYLESCKLDELYRKEMSKMATIYITYEQDLLSGAKSKHADINHNLGEMAHALFDDKLSEEDDADFNMALFMNTTVSLAYKDAMVDESLISDLEKDKLIR